MGARDPEKPSHVGAAHYEVPANDTLVISSGYLHEPRATLIIRTGVSEATVYRVPHTERLLISLAPHGLKVEATDKVEAFAYSDPHAIHAHDTAPMILRGESFHHHKNVMETSVTTDSDPSGVLLGRTQPIASGPSLHLKAQIIGSIDREAV